jgi:simple sugar transport system ATP-binding protein
MNKSSAVAPHILEMANIVKRFPGVLANDHISLSVRRGEIHGLLGENGAGKTTLMNILFGLYHADQGAIHLNGAEFLIRSPQEAIALGIGMVHQQFTLIPKMTVSQNIILGLKDTPAIVDLDNVGEEIANLADRQRISIDPGAMVWQLSVGEQQRVEILKALYREAQLLILDEPTSVLTPQETSALFESLRSMVQAGITIIFITHKLDEVITLTDRVTILRDGRVVDVVETAQTSPRELAQKMVGREVVLRVDRLAVEPGETVLDVHGVSALNDKDLPALREISFSVAKGEIVGIAGVSGNGQRELVEVLCGIRPAQAGATNLLGKDIGNRTPKEIINQGIGLIPEDSRREGLGIGLSVRDNIILKNQNTRQLRAWGPFLDNHAIKEYCEGLVNQFGVRTPSIKTETGKLSGGNLQRLILARELSRDPMLLIANQPTKGLDVGATEYVYQQLLDARSAGRAVLLISDNLDEILTLSDRVLVLYQGHIVGEVPGEEALPEQLGLLMGGRSLDS